MRKWRARNLHETVFSTQREAGEGGWSRRRTISMAEKRGRAEPVRKEETVRLIHVTSLAYIKTIFAFAQHIFRVMLDCKT